MESGLYDQVVLDLNPTGCCFISLTVLHEVHGSFPAGCFAFLSICTSCKCVLEQAPCAGTTSLIVQYILNAKSSANYGSKKLMYMKKLITPFLELISSLLNVLFNF